MKSFTARIGLGSNSTSSKKDSQKLPTIGAGSSLAKQVSNCLCTHCTTPTLFVQHPSYAMQGSLKNDVILSRE